MYRGNDIPFILFVFNKKNIAVIVNMKPPLPKKDRVFINISFKLEFSCYKYIAKSLFLRNNESFQNISTIMYIKQSESNILSLR